MLDLRDFAKWMTVVLIPILLISCSIANDFRIKKEIEEKLKTHPMLNQYELKVEVEGGIVTIWGSVREGSHKTAAEKMIKEIRGVKSVKNELVVKAEDTDSGLLQDFTTPYF